MGVGLPGGPCALEVKTAMVERATGTTLGTWSGILRSSERFATSVSLSEALRGVVPEWIAQCGHGSIGCPNAAVSVLG